MSHRGILHRWLVLLLLLAVVGCHRTVHATADAGARTDAAAHALPSRLRAQIEERRQAHNSALLRRVELSTEPAARNDALRAAAAPIPLAITTQTPATSEAERLARVRSIISSRVERALHGDVRYFRSDAEVRWELAFLRELGTRADLPADWIPPNEFELLDQRQLDEIDARLQNHLDALNVAAAALPENSLRLAVDTSNSTLEAVRAAKRQHPGADLVARFAHLPRSDVSNELVAWIDGRMRQREPELKEREIGLLQEVLDRDDTDVSVFMRLQELQGRYSVPETSRLLALDRIRSNGIERPARGVVTVEQVLEMHRARFLAPLRAIEHESALRVLWAKLHEIEPPELRARWLPDELATSFDDWVASQLRDSDLVEASGYLRDGLEFLRAIKGRRHPERAARLDIDRQAATRELAAIGRELSWRRTHHSGRAPAANVSGTPPVLASRLEAWARNHWDEVQGTRRGRDALRQSLDLYLARTTAPLAEAHSRRRALELAELDDHVLTCRLDAGLIAREARETPNGHHPDDVQRAALDRASTLLQLRRRVIEDALRAPSVVIDRDNDQLSAELLRSLPSEPAPAAIAEGLQRSSTETLVTRFDAALTEAGFPDPAARRAQLDGWLDLRSEVLYLLPSTRGDLLFLEGQDGFISQVMGAPGERRADVVAEHLGELDFQRRWDRYKEGVRRSAPDRGLDPVLVRRAIESMEQQPRWEREDLMREAAQRGEVDVVMTVPLIRDETRERERAEEVQREVERREHEGFRRGRP